MKNRIIAIFLIAALCFTLTACGGSSSDSGIQWDNDGENNIADYDFGVGISFEGTMLGTLEKLNYKDLANEADTLKERTEKGIKDSDLGKYELSTDFEELDVSLEEAAEAGYEMGDFLYCAGTEEEDMELGVLETAAYHNPTENKYYQYIIYNTRSYYGAENTDTQAIADVMSNALGVSVDPEKLQEAAKLIEEKAKASKIEETDTEEEEVTEEEPAEGEEPEETEEEDPEELEETIDGYGEDEELSEDEYEVEVEDEDDGVLYDENGEPIDMDDLEFDFDEEGNGEEYYPCFMKQTEEQQGEGFTDKVTFYLIAENMGEDNIVIYSAVERYRIYDEQ